MLTSQGVSLLNVGDVQKLATIFTKVNINVRRKSVKDQESARCVQALSISADGRG
jgi:hypothetical protein